MEGVSSRPGHGAQSAQSMWMTLLTPAPDCYTNGGGYYGNNAHRAGRDHAREPCWSGEPPERMLARQMVDSEALVNNEHLEPNQHSFLVKDQRMNDIGLVRP